MHGAINEFSFLRKKLCFVFDILDFYVFYKSLNFKAFGVIINITAYKKAQFFFFNPMKHQDEFVE